ncbi:MAG TPA: ATP-binding cassette domain-containing protein [Actinomycetota bacterium]|jgi:ABC-type lipoprotein export system ATPase subunit|uniref:Lipoprotein-releasing system ATP-binding protein n=1 Tax=Tessaracoccus bendigoensis DSM 12906 TaxID=1123357 RepID=A0A1M6HG13_9ACTN|nr:ATP-binding cassette domain-containing protein [Tessaracoccus bendigoensis]SHJ21131.1 lipoprotein-releasing system ATP-binding protein [Tessaracoccus bendigoensis DSM 12906]HQZ85220.1 ATP-binding cassette domain-containing protein [Actinomycetota bacterium]
MRLVAEGLHFSYPGGDRSVLANLSFEVQSGTSAAIIGPSGSGKTTLLSVLGGLLPPQRGLFRCTDDDGLDHAPADVATWVLQTVSLLPERSVRDNVCLGAYLDGTPRDLARERAADALAVVGLADRASEPAGVLSGGEGQRVAIARALASRRPLIFADEPTGQLDASTTAAVLDAFFALASRTIVLITHDETAAARCDIVWHLVDGTLVRSEAGQKVRR